MVYNENVAPFNWSEFLEQYNKKMEGNIKTKRTKIVATLGPATEKKSTITSMIDAGLNMARFNFSHGEHAWHRDIMQNVRDAARDTGASVAVLADFQGPHIRTDIAEPVAVQKGEVVRLFDRSAQKSDIAKSQGDGKVIVIDCPHMVEKLEKGHDIYIEDGLMRLRVTDHIETHVMTEVMAGGIIKNNKGVNIPDADIPLPAMTSKDYDDLSFALEQNVDYVALSFVRDASEVNDLRSYMQKILQRDTDVPKIIAKIERKEAIENLSGILDAVDAVMVARGDLGIETDPTGVTLLQKKIVAEAIHKLKPVIVATQMLASMEHNPRPTRAEIADVTNAVIDHTDAVMLSAETTVGSFPVKTVETMARIAVQTEISPFDDLDHELPLAFDSEEVHVARSAYAFTRTMDARAVVMFSESGYTAQMLSHYRPERLILVATNRQKTYNELALVWGVLPFLFDGTEGREECIEAMIEQAQDEGLLHKGDLVVSILGSTKEGKKLELEGSRIV